MVYGYRKTRNECVQAVNNMLAQDKMNRIIGWEIKEVPDNVNSGLVWYFEVMY